MNPTWEFFTRVVSTDATHCQSVWQWRCRCTYGSEESPPFQSLAECVADARKNGYAGSEPHLSVVLVPCAPCQPAPGGHKPCELHARAAETD